MVLNTFCNHLDPRRMRHLHVRGKFFPHIFLVAVGHEVPIQLQAVDLKAASTEHSHESSGIRIPESGTVFLSVNDNDKPRSLPIAESLFKLGYRLVATRGTAQFIADRNIPVTPVYKASEGRPNVVDDIKNGGIDLIINTPLGQRARSDEYALGWAAIKYRVPLITTLSAAEAIVRGLRTKKQRSTDYHCLQE